MSVGQLCLFKALYNVRRPLILALYLPHMLTSVRHNYDAACNPSGLLHPPETDSPLRVPPPLTVVRSAAYIICTGWREDPCVAPSYPAAALTPLPTPAAATTAPHPRLFAGN